MIDKDNKIPFCSIKELFELIKSFLTALIFAFLFRSLLYDPYHIPSGSMKPNLIEGDYIFVSKYTYGYSRYSFPFGINIFSGRKLELNKPKRGDIIVFKLPSNTDINYIKRLVGLPGDKIQVKNNILYINDIEVKRNYVSSYNDIVNPSSIFRKYMEFMPNGKEYYIINQVDKDRLYDTDPIYVPKNHYFFMGDNRDNSQDSRVMNKVGFVPEENIVGRAEIVFFSCSASLFEPWKWISKFRFDRFLINLKPI